MARYVIDKKTAYHGSLSKHDVEDIARSHLKCNFAFLQSFLNYLKPILYAGKMCSNCPAIN